MVAHVHKIPGQHDTVWTPSPPPRMLRTGEEPVTGSSSVVVASAFDAAAFGVPYYRVTNATSPNLPEAIANVKIPPVIIDAKVPSDDVVGTQRLVALGFRRVCMQVTLARKVDQAAAESVPGVEIVPSCAMESAILDAHVRNFKYDRFSLDERLPAEGRVRLYGAWLANSLAGLHGKMTARSGVNVCTFSIEGDEAVIDLMSVLESGQGLGTRLLAAVLRYARRNALRQARVTTECENLPAWRLYQKSAFVPVGYTTALHLVEGIPPE